MELKVLGKSYPMSAGIDALKELTADLQCNIENLGDVLSSMGAMENMEAMCMIAAAFMRSAYRREKVRCSLWHEECTAEEPPTKDMLLSAIDTKDGTELLSAVMQTLSSGQKGDVEVKAEKNGKGHAGVSK